LDAKLFHIQLGDQVGWDWWWIRICFPVIGGIGSIFFHPIGNKKLLICHLYIAFWGRLYATYHLLWEPETTIGFLCKSFISTVDGRNPASPGMYKNLQIIG